VVVLFLGRAVAPKGGETAEWASYLLLGTLYPLLLLGFALAARTRGAASRIGGVLEHVLGALALAASLLLLTNIPHPAALAAAVVHFAIARVLDRHPESRWGPGEVLVELLVLAAAWNAATSLGFQTLVGRVRLETFVRTPFIGILPLCALLVVAGLRTRPVATSRPRAGKVGSAAALVVFALTAFRVDCLFDYAALYHWGFFVGPAELVRQGGWLLWDVPAQYGFLSTLTIAFVPDASVWDGFFHLNAVLLLLSASLLFFQLRSLRSGAANFLFALLTTLSAVFWLPGLPGLNGWSWPLVTPSGGPVRFIWCLVLMTVLRLAAERGRAGRPRGDLMLAGSVVWLLGSLWSFESAVYCSASWLPAYGLMAWQETAKGDDSGSSSSRHLARLTLLLSVPALLATAVIAAITGYYLARLGHPPDWYGFAEFALAFGSGFGAEPIDPHGSVWLLFVVFCAVSTAVAAALQHGGIDDLVPLVGAWGGLWAVGSYFVGRSVEVAVTNLAPVWCTVIALLLGTLRAWPDQARWKRWIEMVCAAVLVVVLTLALGGRQLVSPTTWRMGWHQAWSIEVRRPVMDSDEGTLLARLQPTDPVVFCTEVLPAGSDGPGSRAPAGAWLPIRPLPMFVTLPEARRRVYVSRFIARVRLGGWLLRTKSSSWVPPGCDWLPALLQPTHEPRKSYENDSFRLTWFEIRDQGGGG